LLTTELNKYDDVVSRFIICYKIEMNISHLFKYNVSNVIVWNYEEPEDTKWVTRRRKVKKDIQCNDQTKNDKL